MHGPLLIEAQRKTMPSRLLTSTRKTRSLSMVFQLDSACRGWMG